MSMSRMNCTDRRAGKELGTRRGTHRRRMSRSKPLDRRAKQEPVLLVLLGPGACTSSTTGAWSMMLEHIAKKNERKYEQN